MADIEKTSTGQDDVINDKGTPVVAGGVHVEELGEPDEAFVVKRKELWSYYIYYIGNSGLGPFNFAPSQFQNLLYLAGHNLGQATTACDDSVPCVINFAGHERTINSAVLLVNGIAFAIQVVLFLAIGSLADFGRWRPSLLFAFTIVSIAVSFAWLGVTDPSKWQAAAALYVIGLIAYQGALSFWTAAFPGLARNLPEMQESRSRLISEETTTEQHNALDSLMRNRVSNVAFTVCSVGEIIVIAILIGILFGVHANDSTESNTKALSTVIAYSGAVWLVCALPWFAFEKHRPGRELPPGSTFLTVGFQNLYQAAKNSKHLPDTLLYLITFFLMSDTLNTAVTVIGTLQSSVLVYNSIQLNYVLLVGIAAQAVGIYAFWLIQKRFLLSTKTMFTAVCAFIVLLCGWGCIGNWTDKFGFKHGWEFYLYQVVYGLFVCPWYSYSQTMVSEVIPEGHAFLYFSVFACVGKCSAFIGPFVTSAIADRTNNTSSSFYFLFALGIVSCLFIPFINIPRSRRNCAKFLELEKQQVYHETL
ncbi:hypothetical protein OIV83_002356 [Microbotryomycetes sp. JL201]|nr:hypothetical protein OIV83_002356 [Microbotryomycetes sp. JL201]